MSLADKIRKARESTVEVGGYTFTVRRPTDVEMLRLRAEGLSVDALLGFVVGWAGVRQIDVVPGGDPVEAKFDAETAREWLSDRPDLLTPLVDEVLAQYRKHVESLESAAKN